MFTQELCGNLYVDAGENQQGDIQGESERAKASWKDGHVSFIAFDRKKTKQQKTTVLSNAFQDEAQEIDQCCQM